MQKSLKTAQRQSLYFSPRSARRYNVVQHSERVHKSQPPASPLREAVAPTSYAASIVPKAVASAAVATNENAFPRNVGRRRPAKAAAAVAAPVAVVPPPTMVPIGNAGYAPMTLNYAQPPMYNVAPPQHPMQPQHPIIQQQQSMPAFPSFASLQPIQYNQLNQPPFAGGGGGAPLGLGQQQQHQQQPPPMQQAASATSTSAKAGAKVAKEYSCTFCPFRTYKKKNLSIHLQVSALC